MTRPAESHYGQFAKEGYLVLENALSCDELRRLQRAFDRCAAAARPAWVREVAAGTRPAAFFDIPDPLSREPLFLELVDHPSYIDLLLAFTNDELLFIGAQFRVVPSSPLSYVGWHYDVDRQNTPTHLKIQLYVEDVSADGGPFAFVPGSHKLDSGPYPPVRQLESMPGHRTFPGSAGSAILFDSFGLHTSMVNRTGRARKSIILIYEKWSAEKFAGQRYAHLAERLDTPLRRRLFGLEH